MPARAFQFTNVTSALATGILTPGAPSDSNCRRRRCDRPMVVNDRGRSRRSRSTRCPQSAAVVAGVRRFRTAVLDFLPGRIVQNHATLRKFRPFRQSQAGNFAVMENATIGQALAIAVAGRRCERRQNQNAGTQGCLHASYHSTIRGGCFSNEAACDSILSQALARSYRRPTRGGLAAICASACRISDAGTRHICQSFVRPPSSAMGEGGRTFYTPASGWGGVGGARRSFAGARSSSPTLRMTSSIRSERLCPTAA